MELRHLRYFVVVGEEQHFGRAAERLHIAQPVPSRQIQDLEKEIGFPLFDRLPRGVKLSAAGKLFLEDARRILAEVQEATRCAECVARGKAGTLRVGFVESISRRRTASRRLRSKLLNTFSLRFRALRSCGFGTDRIDADAARAILCRPRLGQQINRGLA